MSRFGFVIRTAALLATTALTAPVLSSAQAPAAAQSEQHIFDIPAQPLTDALIQFGRQAELQASASAEMVRGLRSAPVSGILGWRQALTDLLAGTGLTFRLNGTMVSLEPQPAIPAVDAPSAKMLGPVQVNGDETAETPVGPLVGYVARRSTSGVKTDTPLIEIPQSLTVITRDQMDDQVKVEDVRGILRYAPGTYVSDDNDNRIETLLVRGFQPDQYLDGTRLMNGTFAILKVDPYTIERAELLEGPSSVLYGQGSPGGLLNMISKRPTDDPLHQVDLQAGTRDHYQAAIDLSGPIDQAGHFLYRLDGLLRTERPDVDHVTEQRVDISPAFTWKPDDDTSLTLLTNYLGDPKGGFYDLLPYQGTLLPSAVDRISRSFYPGQPGFYNLDREQYSIGYAFEHKVDETWTVRQNLRYIHQNLNYSEVQPISMQANGHVLNTVPYVDTEHDGALTLDNQAQARFETGPLAHTVLAGLDYGRQSLGVASRYSALSAYVVPLDILAPNYNQTVTLPPYNARRDQLLEQTGLYLQDQIRYGHWSLLLAGRGDWAGTVTDNHLTNLETRQFDRAATEHVGLTYLSDMGLAPYFSYSTSFSPTAGSDYSGAAFKPTTGAQEELGVKYQPSGFNSFFTAAIYDLTQDNVATTDPVHANFSIQTGQVEIRGLELSGVVSLIDGLNLRAAYSRLNSKITKANNGTQGNQLADTPNDLASLWAEYSSRQGALEGFSIGGGVRYVGETYAANTNIYKIPGYTVFDATLRYDLGNLNPSLDGLKLGLTADNLTDKQYVSYCSPVGCRWGVARSVTGSLTYSW